MAGNLHGTVLATCLWEERSLYPRRICTLGQSENKGLEMAKRAKKGMEKKKRLEPLAEGQSGQGKEGPFLQEPEDLENTVGFMMEFWVSFSQNGAYRKTLLLKHRFSMEEVPPTKCHRILGQRPPSQL